MTFSIDEETAVLAKRAGGFVVTAVLTGMLVRLGGHLMESSGLLKLGAKPRGKK